MRIIAFDTTSTSASIALFEDGRIVEEVVLESPDGFSHVLFDALKDILARHNWTLDSVDAFASAAGPGSFTGVRVSLAAAKGLAEAVGRPAFAISNLEAGATLGSQPLRAPWIDARRGEVYGGVYDAAGGVIATETVQPMEDWRSSLPPAAELIACGGIPLAGAIARIAAARLVAGESPDPAAIDANYVRRSDAELLWKD